MLALSSLNIWQKQTFTTLTCRRYVITNAQCICDDGECNNEVFKKPEKLKEIKVVFGHANNFDKKTIEMGVEKVIIREDSSNKTDLALLKVEKDVFEIEQVGILLY